MKKLITLIVCGFTITAAIGQVVPKWAPNAGKAVFSVVTYDKENKILANGNGFYIDENGTAVSDYTLFKDAHHAVIVTSDGKELPVERILGANYIYDVVKFRTQVGKKITALTPAIGGNNIGQTVYLLPYSTQKAKSMVSGTVSRIDTISNNCLYFSMDMTAGEKAISCPVMNEEGQVIGLLQRSSDSDKAKSYAIGIDFASSLSINALSGNDPALSSIGIRKALPDTEDQALVYLYMNSSKLDGKDYLGMLDDFILQYPDNTEGYQRRATYYASLQSEEGNKQAENNLKQMLKAGKDKSESHYQIAKFIYNYSILPEDKRNNNEWNMDRALEEINKALEGKKEGIYYNTQGDIYFAMKKFEEAYQAYSNVNKSNVASAASFYSAAKSLELVEGSSKEEIVVLMDSAVARFNMPYGQDAAAYLIERARIKMSMKDYRGAVIDYNHFYDSMMGHVAADFYFYRQEAEMKSRMYSQAIADIDKAIELDNTNIDYWLEKAGIHIRVGQTDEASATLHKIIQMAPQNGVAHRMLGYVLIRQNNKKEGLRLLAKAKELGDEVANQLIEKYK